MDSKSVIVLIICFIVLVLWQPLINRLYPPKPINRSNETNNISAALTAGTTNLPNGVSTNINLQHPRIEEPIVVFPKSEEPEKLITLESADARYYFTSHGGGFKFIELKKFPEHVVTKSGNGLRPATLNKFSDFPILTVLGGRDLIGDGVFEISQVSSNKLIAQKTVPLGVKIIKEFEIRSNYLFKAKISIQNVLTQSVSIPTQEWFLGMAAPLNKRDNGQLMGLMWYNGSKTESINDAWFANRVLGCLPGVPRTEFLAGDGKTNVIWASVQNRFFTIAAIPIGGAPRLIARKSGIVWDESDNDTRNNKVSCNYGFQAALVYPGTNLNTGAEISREFLFYVGPKEYNTLAKLSLEIDQPIDLIMEFNGFFGFFAKALLLSMNGINSLGLGYGMAIIVITFIIKLVFWPLTTASTRSMKRMAALQPQMKEIQEKYKDNPAKMNQKLMEFMKENKVSPMSGCFPMLLQIPVFIGFYKMLQSAIELRGARFLWVFDLSEPDTVWIIPSLGFPVNPLPLLMGASMLWQSHMTPPSPGVDPMQQKIMKYMPLIFILFLYNFPAGLSLYWTVQNLLTILQMKLTKNIEPLTATQARPKSIKGLGRK